MMHVWNRDALKERIKVVTAEAKTYLDSAQARLEQQQREATTERQNFKVELDKAQRVTTQITSERNDLRSKITRLNNVNRK